MQICMQVCKYKFTFSKSFATKYKHVSKSTFLNQSTSFPSCEKWKLSGIHPETNLHNLHVHSRFSRTSTQTETATSPEMSLRQSGTTSLTSASLESWTRTSEHSQIYSLLWNRRGLNPLSDRPNPSCLELTSLCFLTQRRQDQQRWDDRLLYESQLSAELQDGFHPHLHRGHLRQTHILRALRRIRE